MRARTRISLVAVALAVPLGAAAQGPAGKSWLSEASQWETRLAESEVVSVAEVGVGVTDPERVALRSGGVDFAAVFKPIRRGRHHGFFESYEAEVAAYRLDVLLGLDMVPPTVVRKIDGDLGSLQLWVEGCTTYKRVGGSAPQTPRFSQQISRMKMFDNLISNADRNAGNFLLDSDWNVVLIDHSRAFVERKGLFDGSKLPAQYDRKLVERLRSLDLAELESALGDVLEEGQIETLLERRDRLLGHLSELTEKLGERAVLFEP